MKQLIQASFMLSILLAGQGCDSTEARYIDPNSGKVLSLKEDAKTGLLVDAETGKPVEMYVDKQTKDTINGRTGEVINGKLRKGENGRYVYRLTTEDDNAAKKSTHYSGDQDVKIKYDDGEYKIKKKGYKKEVERDGDITIKDGNKKIKIDGKTGEKKIKYDD